MHQGFDDFQFFVHEPLEETLKYRFVRTVLEPVTYSDVKVPTICVNVKFQPSPGTFSRIGQADKFIPSAVSNLWKQPRGEKSSDNTQRLSQVPQTVVMFGAICQGAKETNKRWNEAWEAIASHQFMGSPEFFSAKNRDAAHEKEFARCIGAAEGADSTQLRWTYDASIFNKANTGACSEQIITQPATKRARKSTRSQAQKNESQMNLSSTEESSGVPTFKDLQAPCVDPVERHEGKTFRAIVCVETEPSSTFEVFCIPGLLLVDVKQSANRQKNYFTSVAVQLPGSMKRRITRDRVFNFQTPLTTMVGSAIIAACREEMNAAPLDAVTPFPDLSTAREPQQILDMLQGYRYNTALAQLLIDALTGPRASKATCANIRALLDWRDEFTSSGTLDDSFSGESSFIADVLFSGFIAVSEASQEDRFVAQSGHEQLTKLNALRQNISEESRKKLVEVDIKIPLPVSHALLPLFCDISKLAVSQEKLVESLVKQIAILSSSFHPRDDKLCKPLETKRDLARGKRFVPCFVVVDLPDILFKFLSGKRHADDDNDEAEPSLQRPLTLRCNEAETEVYLDAHIELREGFPKLRDEFNSTEEGPKRLVQLFIVSTEWGLTVRDTVICICADGNDQYYADMQNTLYCPVKHKEEACEQNERILMEQSETETREQAEREQAEREQAEREQAEREQAEREQAEREQAEREQAEREQAEREQAEREQAEREQAEREQAERERVDREQADREQADREQAGRPARERVNSEGDDDDDGNHWDGGAYADEDDASQTVDESTNEGNDDTRGGGKGRRRHITLDPRQSKLRRQLSGSRLTEEFCGDLFTAMDHFKLTDVHCPVFELVNQNTERLLADERAKKNAAVMRREERLKQAQFMDKRLRELLVSVDKDEEARIELVKCSICRGAIPKDPAEVGRIFCSGPEGDRDDGCDKNWPVCGHLFCKDCIKASLKEKQKCPECSLFGDIFKVLDDFSLVRASTRGKS